MFWLLRNHSCSEWGVNGEADVAIAASNVCPCVCGVWLCLHYFTPLYPDPLITSLTLCCSQAFGHCPSTFGHIQGTYWFDQDDNTCPRMEPGEKASYCNPLSLTFHSFLYYCLLFSPSFPFPSFLAFPSLPSIPSPSSSPSLLSLCSISAYPQYISSSWDSTVRIWACYHLRSKWKSN